MKFSALCAILSCLVSVGASADATLPLPHARPIKVAFVLSEGATVIDFAGPWEVFQDVMLDEHGNMVMPFDLYTVAPSKDPLHTSGGAVHPGLDITPDYSFADAPEPDVVVIGAQSGGPGLSAWLQKLHADHKIMFSVCTGAFKLAQAGLLDGKPATTHHWFYDQFSQKFPDVKLQRSVRYVQADPLTLTAGGLTSGVDLALHVVAELYGDEVAQRTADYMEYQSTGWKTNQGIAAGNIPVWRQEWAGEIAPGVRILVHIATRGVDTAITADIPSRKLASMPVTLQDDGDKVELAFAIAGHPASFSGQPDAAHDKITGTYTQDGKSSPLTLTQLPDAKE
ncbi:MAG TPA: DJ-1/PfpI family protein [Gammaproteobacteria bacterium]|nr:DJ-1/PfpI family protein [Gammaproteobacteria bacterium]